MESTLPSGDLDELILTCLLDELSNSIAWDLHFLIKSKQITLEQLMSEAPLVTPKVLVQAAGGATGQSGAGDHWLTSSSASESNARCQICHVEVSGSRFAAHLEKCFDKAKRAKLC